MNKNWSIRGYNHGDEEEINDLFNTIFGKDRTLEYWNWEFKKNPDGSKIFVAVDKDQIIAHLGSLHRKIKFRKEYRSASLEVDGMTHPNYGRQGIFMALGKKLLDESKKEEIDIIIGFPNEKAIPGHRKLHCIELFSLHVMIKPMNFKNVSKKLFSNRLICIISEKVGKYMLGIIYRVRKPKIEEDISLMAISEFDDRFDKFWEEAKSSYPIILHRDKRYMNWRYGECPGQKYHKFVAEKENRILAVVVVRIVERFGLSNGAIVDVLSLPNHEKVVHGLLLRAIEHLKDKRVDLVACSIPKWSGYNDVLKKCGFMKCPKRLNPKEEPFIIYPLSKEINMDFVKNITNWYITWGDTDVV
ncbi:MAG: GNAT family N-acetyltransferase [Thermoplasmata archaeon]|nr:MAG: GNAT family N-acetyltransferase [Thermoplasmata archaeon]